MSSKEQPSLNDFNVSPAVRSLLKRMQQKGLKLASLGDQKEKKPESNPKEGTRVKRPRLRTYLKKNSSCRALVAQEIRDGASFDKATKKINATIPDQAKRFHRTSLTSLAHRLCQEAGARKDPHVVRKTLLDWLEQ